MGTWTCSTCHAKQATPLTYPGQVLTASPLTAAGGSECRRLIPSCSLHCFPVPRGDLVVVELRRPIEPHVAYSAVDLSATPEVNLLRGLLLRSSLERMPCWQRIHPTSGAFLSQVFLSQVSRVHVSSRGKRKQVLFVCGRGLWTLNLLPAWLLLVFPAAAGGAATCSK